VGSWEKVDSFWEEIRGLRKWETRAKKSLVSNLGKFWETKIRDPYESKANG
jgi:hypothetical protein